MRVCMYVCVCVCMCMCVCMYACVYVCASVYVCACVCECVHGRGCHSSVETIVQVNMMSLSDEGACMTEQISEYQISCLQACSRLGTCLQCQRFRLSVSLGHAICKQASELYAHMPRTCVRARERERGIGMANEGRGREKEREREREKGERREREKRKRQRERE